MVPQREWRDKGSMMDKRTARKVNRENFQYTIGELRQELLLKHHQQQKNHQEDMNAASFQVFVRKRPMLDHEPRKKEFDVLTVTSESDVFVHECQMHPDMKHMFIQSHHHTFSRCFDETCATYDVYKQTAQPLLHHALSGGKSVSMMYGQTGSGKTFTTAGFQQFIGAELFDCPERKFQRLKIAVIEIAGSKCFDLLNRHAQLQVCDDGQGSTALLRLVQLQVDTNEELMSILKEANQQRATHATNVNQVSSRSHALYRLTFESSDDKRSNGQLTIVDLAGSERNEDSFYHTKDRQRESIGINTSHLALKQCVRALVGQTDLSTVGHIPYRSSTLTRVLKDCLWAPNSKAAVIATVSPIATDTEHTLHTLQVARLMMLSSAEDNAARVPCIQTRVPIVIPSISSASKAPMVVHIRDWSHERVLTWWNALKKGVFAKYSHTIPSSVDGRQLLRLGLPRFTQLCDGNSGDAEYIYNALKRLQDNQRVHKTLTQQ